jgi:hypothetical protein
VASPYDPPEQRPSASPSVAQDVYALGRLLAELMADAPGVGPLQGDLQAVVERATAKDPLARYETVAGLAEDVGNLIEHLPVLAAQAGRAHGVALWVRRHRLVLVAGTCVVALLAAVTARLWQQHVQAQSLDVRDRQARAFMDEAFPRAGRDAQRWQAALVRARQGFEGQPTLRGQVLAQLGVAGRAIGQPEGALQVLGEAHSLLQRVARADDPARLGAAAELASQWLLNGKPESADQATAWGQQALAVCRDASARCATTRASAHFALSLAAQSRNDIGAQRQALERQAREQAEARRLAPANE